MSQHVIVFAADNKYTNQLVTAIKSVCTHNQNIKFYILNDDIPKEWFLVMEQYLEKLNCSIRDVKLIENEVTKFTGPFSHINYVTYFRYMIPEVVTEDRALYLDVDLVVTGELDELFSLNLDNHTIAAVPDWNQGEFSGQFNAGVLLFNLVRCRNEDFTERMISYTREHLPNLKVGDQTVLNHFYPDYLPLPERYNTQIGAEWLGAYYKDGEAPVILHYSTNHKPWSNYGYNSSREVWWFYHNLDWQELLAYWKIKKQDMERIFSLNFKQECFVLTNSGDIEHIEYLIQSLPEYRFNIAAHTLMSPNLRNLDQYKNAYTYPMVTPPMLEKMFHDSSIYLDINHFNEVNDIVQKARESGKSIFAFSNTKHREDDYYVEIVPESTPEKMVECLKAVCTENQ
ncbi:glycosyltransferase family 8 protein [Streptococcus marmotae]|uniref:glycosyltransferase family 8 protein n=1 Tax=Streptococcus marmotae TaxID=1825069 RepID=UPI00082BC804|nr:glycosyltransferase family 8 protein [Streptococcus marmotae]